MKPATEKKLEIIRKVSVSLHNLHSYFFHSLSLLWYSRIHASHAYSGKKWFKFSAHFFSFCVTDSLPFLYSYFLFRKGTILRRRVKLTLSLSDSTPFILILFLLRLSLSSSTLFCSIKYWHLQLWSNEQPLWRCFSKYFHESNLLLSTQNKQILFFRKKSGEKHNNDEFNQISLLTLPHWIFVFKKTHTKKNSIKNKLW